MSPEQLLLVLLVVGGALLTIVLLGCLRLLAVLRLELASGQRHRTHGDAIAAGRPLPDFITNQLGWGHEDGLILFLSRDCPMCEELISILPRVRIEHLAFAIMGDRADAVDRVASFGVVFTEEQARAAWDYFRLEYVPLGVHQRDGLVVGSIHTEALVSVEEIERFWRYGGARLMEVAA